MFYVKRWDNDEILSTWDKLAVAKRYAKGAGHTGEMAPNGRYLLIAYVADESGTCVYNPVFRGEITAAAAGLVNAQQSDSF